MSTNFSDYSDGIQTLYPNVVTWSEPANSVLEVLIDGVPTAAYTRNINDITLNLAPIEGALVVIHRVTTIVPSASFGDGTALTNEDLDTDQEQQFNLIEEHQSDEAVVTADIKRDIGDVEYVEFGSLQDQITALIDGSVLSTDFTVSIPSQGRLSAGDVVTGGTKLEDIIIDMLQQDTPPVFSLAGSGAKTVESGTLITPTLTPTYTANDAGPANNYDLRKNAGLIFNNPVPTPHIDGAFNIVDTSVSYEATVDHDANVLPLGSLISNTITYTGARAAFHDMGGDIVNIRANTLTNIGVANGSNLVRVGDGVSLTYIWAYPDTLQNTTSLFLQNTGGNFDITSDIVQEADQLVDDANASNPINYKVFSYTALIAIKVTDTLTVTI